MTQPPSDEPKSDPFTGASASTSKARSSKWKVAANPTPQKKARKAMGSSSSGIRIDKPAPKAPASTPQSGPPPKILMHHSKWYTHNEYFFLLDYFLIHEPLCRVPQNINPDSSAKSALVGSESPKLDKPSSP
jgi:hypothetical protein